MIFDQQSFNKLRIHLSQLVFDVDHFPDNNAFNFVDKYEFCKFSDRNLLYKFT